ncbi:MAG TPA: DUF1800 domain-containing protein [Isosphaeraceae bacterium]
MNSSILMTDPERAWAPFEPGAGDPWDLARVAHLHRRAGFAAPWAVLQRDLKDGPTASINRLLEGEPDAGDGTPAREFATLLDGMAARLGPSGGPARLQGIWLYRMIFTPHPLRERMTLFWHDHFATSITKVNNPALLQRQNAMLRAQALGSFRDLLGAMGTDPAMLAWLDATVNRKTHPNENYAREVMELFTLGRGHYTETDVQEAARAYTGRFVVGEQYREVPAQHDDGPKTVLGRTGPLRGEDVDRILLEQPACAEFLCGKLFGLFVSEVDPPPAGLIAPLAAALRASGYDIRVPVARILRSRLFFDRAARWRRVKAPVEFAVGTIRALEVLRPTAPAEALAEACARMGQGLYAPPSVAGWDGGPAWINTATLLARSNFALALLSATDGTFGKRLDPRALAGRHAGTSPEDVARFFIDLLVQDALDAEVRGRVVATAGRAADPAAAAREAAALVLTSPEYQRA